MALKGRVEGRLHDQHPLVAELLLRGETLHLLEGPVEIEVRSRLAFAVDRGRGIAAGGLDLAVGEEARLDHVAQNLVRPGTGGRQVHVRGIFGRRLEQACQHRRFRERQVLGRLAEIVIRRRHDAVGAAAHVGAVEIELEDLVLGQVEFEPDRQEGFLDLALEGALVGQEQVLGQLLRDRGAALDHAAALGIDEEGAEGADGVDAPMLVEPPVFRRQRRLDHVVGEILKLVGIVEMQASAPDFLAIAVEEGDREVLGLEPVVFGLAEGGEGERQHRDRADRAEGGRLAGQIQENADRAAKAQTPSACPNTIPMPPPGRDGPGRGRN